MMPGGAVDYVRNLSDCPFPAEPLHYPPRIADISGFSAHADKDELMKWLFTLKLSPRQVFVVHGEPDAAGELSSAIKGQMGWKVSVPNYLEETMLD